MKLECSICKMKNGATQKTDRLWLIQIGGRDYLVCRYHRRKYAKEAIEETTEKSK